MKQYNEVELAKKLVADNFMCQPNELKLVNSMPIDAGCPFKVDFLDEEERYLFTVDQCKRNENIVFRISKKLWNPAESDDDVTIVKYASQKA